MNSFATRKKPVQNEILGPFLEFCILRLNCDLMRRLLRYTFFLLALVSFAARAQKVEISLGPDEISQSDAWTITVVVYNSSLKTYDKFPDIKGFRKGNTSTRLMTSNMNGQITSTEAVVMTYFPLKTGVITVNSFGMKVNDKYVRVAGKKVTVKPAVQYRRPNRSNSYKTPNDFFGEEEPEFLDVKDDAFLMLTTDKSEVYVGEGVNASLAFYMAENNVSMLRFHDLSKQMTEIIKKLKPTNCWEENFNIENVEGELATVNGRSYLRYNIYQATFYPFNNQQIVFPGVSLDMIKMKVARNPSLFRSNTIEGLKTYSSKTVNVRVKDLPPHPLRNSVAVGEFKLNEQIADQRVQTGQSVAYEFNITGEGNISSIAKPTVNTDGVFEIYDPSNTQEIGRSRDKIYGTKSFRYFMIPREPGAYKLAPYFQWIFFSPARKTYDTLRSDLQLTVEGPSRKNETIESNDPGAFYDTIEVADNSLKKVSTNAWERWAFNSFLVLMLGASAFLLLRK